MLGLGSNYKFGVIFCQSLNLTQSMQIMYQNEALAISFWKKMSRFFEVTRGHKSQKRSKLRLLFKKISLEVNKGHSWSNMGKNDDNRSNFDFCQKCKKYTSKWSFWRKISKKSLSQGIFWNLTKNYPKFVIWPQT